jgi:hypothetical protein
MGRRGIQEKPGIAKEASRAAAGLIVGMRSFGVLVDDEGAVKTSRALFPLRYDLVPDLVIDFLPLLSQSATIRQVGDYPKHYLSRLLSPCHSSVTPTWGPSGSGKRGHEDTTVRPSGAEKRRILAPLRSRAPNRQEPGRPGDDPGTNLAPPSKVPR